MDFSVVQKLMADPELSRSLSDPNVLSKLQRIMTNPGAVAEYANDPSIMSILQKMQKYITGPSASSVRSLVDDLISRLGRACSCNIKWSRVKSAPNEQYQTSCSFLLQAKAKPVWCTCRTRHTSHKSCRRLATSPWSSTSSQYALCPLTYLCAIAVFQTWCGPCRAIGWSLVLPSHSLTLASPRSAHLRAAGQLARGPNGRPLRTRPPSASGLLALGQVFAKVDCDAAADVAERCAVRGFPTFVFFVKARARALASQPLFVPSESTSREDLRRIV